MAWLWNLLHVRGFVFLPFQILEFVLFQIIPGLDVPGTLRGSSLADRRIAVKIGHAEQKESPPKTPWAGLSLRQRRDGQAILSWFSLKWRSDVLR